MKFPTAAALILLLRPPSFGADWQAGAATVSITPEPGLPLAGYYFERGAEGTLDDIGAHAVVFEKDGTVAAVVTLDLISTTRDMVEMARAEIEKRTGIPGSSVLISATHTHTAPTLPRPGRRGIADGGDKPAVHEYAATLPGKIAEAVAKARATLAPARLLAATGSEPRLSYNRRFCMADGSVGWNPGKKNPAILRTAGPIDPEVGVLCIDRPTAPPTAAPLPVACLVNFAMHPDTTGGTRYSADYPGALGRQLKAWRGADLVVPFANGCSGNLNHIDVGWPDGQKGPGEAHRIGTILAAAVMQACKSASPLTDGPLVVRSETVALDLFPIDPDELARARAVAEQDASAGPRPGFFEQVKAYRALDVAARDGKPLEVEVQVIALGPELACVSLPGEIFVELGLAIKASSPFPRIHIAELANGAIGYIPNHKAYAEGAYEVISSRVADGSGEKLVDAAVRILREIHRAMTPPK